MFRKLMLILVVLACIFAAAVTAHAMLGCTARCPQHRQYCQGNPGHYGRHFDPIYQHFF